MNHPTPLLCWLVPWLLSLAAPARAEGWQWLRSENRNVREGNERFAAGDVKAALGAYDRAARELPSEGGVHLNRGIALMRSGQLGPARDALRLAEQPSAAPQVRADAAHDLGITFYREADTLAGENKHDEAQKLFREAAAAFKQALHVRPGDRAAAWNYELAKRRIREQEDKQKEQQEQQKKQEQDQQKQEEQDKQAQQNQQGQQDQDGKPGQDQQQPQDQQPQDQAKKDEAGQPKPEQPKPEQQAQNQPQNEPNAPQNQPESGDPQPADEKVAPEVSRALDALEDGEQNLERVRALNRAARERRRPEKDW